MRTKNDPAGTPRAPDPRSLALGFLTALEKGDRYVNLEIDARLKDEGKTLSPADRALYTRLVYGVTERRITLDHIASLFSSRPPEEMDPQTRNAVRLGLYQLICADRIPDHAAVDSTVSLLRGPRAGFVNAVLRSFLRAGKEYALPDPEKDRVRYLSVLYSVPEALIRLYETALPDGEGLGELLAALNREPKTGLRINTLRLTAEEAAERTGGRISRIAPDVVLADSFSPEIRQGVDEGLWFVQDEASRIAAAAVGAKPGERVADTCACPGGKTFSLAIDMENRGEVRAYDLHANKLSLVRRGAEKLGLTIVSAEERDARDPDPALFGAFDRVLCDAPCSGYGVIAKKPALRYKDPSAAARLPEIQREVLRGASRYVRPGGILVYSTCTLTPAENEEIARGFLAEHPDFLPEPDPFLGGSGMHVFWPHIDGCDGFFAAKMIRRAQ